MRARPSGRAFARVDLAVARSELGFDVGPAGAYYIHMEITTDAAATATTPFLFDPTRTRLWRADQIAIIRLEADLTDHLTDEDLRAMLFRRRRDVKTAIAVLREIADAA